MGGGSGGAPGRTGRAWLRSLWRRRGPASVASGILHRQVRREAWSARMPRCARTPTGHLPPSSPPPMEAGASARSQRCGWATVTPSCACLGVSTLSSSSWFRSRRSRPRAWSSPTAVGRLAGRSPSPRRSFRWRWVAVWRPYGPPGVTCVAGDREFPGRAHGGGRARRGAGDDGGGDRGPRAASTSAAPPTATRRAAAARNRAPTRWIRRRLGA